MRESPRDRRLRSVAARVGQDSGRSAPGVQPNTPGGHHRENVRSARQLSPRSVQFSVAIDNDRFSADPALPAGAGGSRYRRFVEKSIERDDEFALKLHNPSSGEIVGFHTYAHSGGKDARFFIAGVKAEYKMLGLGTVLNYFALNEMYDRGIRKITTHQSASNFAILNLEIGFFDFRIVRGFAVLRKLYGDAPSRND